MIPKKFPKEIRQYVVENKTHSHDQKSVSAEQKKALRPLTEDEKNLYSEFGV